MQVKNIYLLKYSESEPIFVRKKPAGRAGKKFKACLPQAGKKYFLDSFSTSLFLSFLKLHHCITV
jgi:hypothetical protein